jgi:hypothetical protein
MGSSETIFFSWIKKLNFPAGFFQKVACAGEQNWDL